MFHKREQFFYLKQTYPLATRLFKYFYGIKLSFNEHKNKELFKGLFANIQNPQPVLSIDPNRATPVIPLLSGWCKEQKPAEIKRYRIQGFLSI
jgi:hypothetical protein